MQSCWNLESFTPWDLLINLLHTLTLQRIIIHKQLLTLLITLIGQFNKLNSFSDTLNILTNKSNIFFIRMETKSSGIHSLAFLYFCTCTVFKFKHSLIPFHLNLTPWKSATYNSNMSYGRRILKILLYIRERSSVSKYVFTYYKCKDIVLERTMTYFATFYPIQTVCGPEHDPLVPVKGKRPYRDSNQGRPARHTGPAPTLYRLRHDRAHLINLHPLSVLSRPFLFRWMLNETQLADVAIVAISITQSELYCIYNAGAAGAWWKQTKLPPPLWVIRE